MEKSNFNSQDYSYNPDVGLVISDITPQKAEIELKPRKESPRNMSFMRDPSRLQRDSPKNQPYSPKDPYASIMSKISLQSYIMDQAIPYMQIDKQPFMHQKSQSMDQSVRRKSALVDVFTQKGIVLPSIFKQ